MSATYHDQTFTVTKYGEKFDNNSEKLKNYETKDDVKSENGYAKISLYNN